MNPNIKTPLLLVGRFIEVGSYALAKCVQYR